MDPGVLFGLGSAAAFGAGDFSGGLAARRVASLLVAAGAQVVGLACLLVVLALVRPAAPDPAALGLGALAGAFGGLGLAALYRGLSLGSMGLVTALSGVGSVAIPVLVGAALLGTALSTGQWLGVGAAIVAGTMASGATLLGVSRDAIRMSGLAAVGFGLWFVFLDLAADHGELWALVASRGSAAVLVGSMALLRVRGQGPGRTWPLIGLAGALDVTGNAAFVLATGSIPVGVAAALSGLYPLLTMLLARFVLRDALPPLGLAAVGVAVLGIVLISAG
ncbi:MAG TPA: EamA family transporter [Candidatus Limnocylindrales bacterium]|nr:EamA family transporter [Candidatus Limnocylindrales bacterium]